MNNNIYINILKGNVILVFLIYCHFIFQLNWIIENVYNSINKGVCFTFLYKNNIIVTWQAL